ncbi:MAG TPA: hypothetical protein VN653_19760 [Anaerolineales bacterium]|nr:hypothetical protein [Anaerolineales bacterium]
MQMALAEIANDEIFATVLCDVVWRFHVYNQYGKMPERALKALARRAPGYPAGSYKELFELNLEILKTTVEAVKAAPKSPEPHQEFSAFSDVDTEQVLNKLRATFPGQTDKFLSAHLGMAIYWYYLR